MNELRCSNCRQIMHMDHYEEATPDHPCSQTFLLPCPCYEILHQYDRRLRDVAAKRSQSPAETLAAALDALASVDELRAANAGIAKAMDAVRR